MPTVITHAAVPIAAAIALGSLRVPPAMLVAGVLAAMLPDADGIAVNLGLHYDGMWGHRGYTHTLGFALLVGLLGAALAGRWKRPAWQAFALMALCALSHPVLDMFTDGGRAIALLWPASDTRWASPWQPIEVSPISLSRFFSARGATVLRSELEVVWLPLTTLALAALAVRHFRKDT